MSTLKLLRRTRQSYDDKLAEHDPPAGDVVWSSGESQRLRFRQFGRLLSRQTRAAVNERSR
jgi:hypothetical protein